MTEERTIVSKTLVFNPNFKFDNKPYWINYPYGNLYHFYLLIKEGPMGIELGEDKRIFKSGEGNIDVRGKWVLLDQDHNVLVWGNTLKDILNLLSLTTD